MANLSPIDSGKTNVSIVDVNNVDIKELCAPSGINNIIREINTWLSRDFADKSLAIVMADGGVDAFAATISQAFTTIKTGVTLNATPSSSNTTVAPTLAVTSAVSGTVTAKAIRKNVAGVETALAVGDIVSGGHHQFIYDEAINSAAGGWWIIDLTPFSILRSVLNTNNNSVKWSKGADVASATAMALGNDGNVFDITGTTDITSIDTWGVGGLFVIHFDDALVFTHHATNLILPGAANITTAAGDIAVMYEYASGDFRCISYTKADGRPTIGSVLAAEQATTSGTSVDFTDIPDGVKKIVVMMVGFSTSGTSNPIIQIGDAGGIETSGYVGNCSAIGGTSAVVLYTTGFGVPSELDSDIIQVVITLTLQNASTNTWMATIAGAGSLLISYAGAGSKSLSAVLDRVRLTTVGGSDTFDAGAINIQYE